VWLTAARPRAPPSGHTPALVPPTRLGRATRPPRRVGALPLLSLFLPLHSCSTPSFPSHGRACCYDCIMPNSATAVPQHNSSRAQPHHHLPLSSCASNLLNRTEVGPHCSEIFPHRSLAPWPMVRVTVARGNPVTSLPFLVGAELAFSCECCSFRWFGRYRRSLTGAPPRTHGGLTAAAPHSRSHITGGLA
jgi:hypothetical protein